MKFHHDFHHQAYITNLNKAMAGKPKADLVSLMPGAKAAKLNNAGGGHYNHCMFWSTLGPKAGGEPSGALGDAMAKVSPLSSHAPPLLSSPPLSSSRLVSSRLVSSRLVSSYLLVSSPLLSSPLSSPLLSLSSPLPQSPCGALRLCEQKLCLQAFGSYDDFKAQFSAAAAGVFGSGWAWLAVAKDGSVKIVTTPNQEISGTLGYSRVLSGNLG